MSKKVEIMNSDFERRFREWVEDACARWEYSRPSDEYYSRVNSTFPEVLQQSVATAIERGIVNPKGTQFLVKDGRGTQGPYQWFSKNRDPKPCPNWEYFVQVAEFLRYHDVASRNGLRAFFEFDRMDISLYDDRDRIVLICEVKVEPETARSLLEGMRKYQQRINYAAEDLRYDPLQKARYIQTWRPDYFCVTAIGKRHEFRVNYPEGNVFQLEECKVPWV